MSGNIPIEGLASEIERSLTLYSQHVIDGIKKQTKSSAKQLVDLAKSTAPVGKGSVHYKDKISSTVTKESPNAIECTWYVKSPYAGMTHLLTKGHLTSKGTRTRSNSFLADAVTTVLPEYENKVVEIIERSEAD